MYHLIILCLKKNREVDDVNMLKQMKELKRLSDDKRTFAKIFDNLDRGTKTKQAYALNKLL